jgi:hypothetical protein
MFDPRLFISGELIMKIIRSASSLVAASTLALVGLGLAAAAQAGDVYWNVGVSSPGVQLGVSSAPQVVYQPVYQPMYQPVYVQRPPVYVQPRPVVYVQPAPVFVGQPYYGQPQYVQTGWERPGPGWRHGHRHHEQDRYESGRYDGGRSGYDRQDRR